MSGVPHPPQSITALAKANMVRTERSKIKQQIGVLPRMEALGVLADVLEQMPDCCARATAFELLMAVDGVGRRRTLRYLLSAGVQESRHLRELTERQRFALAGLLREGEGKVAA